MNRTALGGLLTIWAMVLALPVMAQPSDSVLGALAEITGIQLRKEDGQLNVAFLVSRPVPMEVVANLPRQVLVVKFSHARLALPEQKTQYVFNDPIVVGVAFEAVDDSTAWAKVRLRTPDVIHQLSQDPANGRALLGLRPSLVPIGIELTGLRLDRQAAASRLTLELSRLPQIEEQKSEQEYALRLKNTAARLRGAPQARDDRVTLAGVEQQGDDTVVRLRLEQPARPSFLALPDPPRVVISFRPAQRAPARPPAATGPAAAASAAKPPPPPRETLEALLAGEPDRVVRSNFEAAERAMAAGNPARAEPLFQAAAEAAAGRRLGIRAAFRALDARFDLLRAAKAVSYHGLIAQYQSLIRRHEKNRLAADVIPAAFFQIGRSYQLMGFSQESNTYFQMVQERFPAAEPYTSDSYLRAGENFLAMRKYAEGAASIRRYQEGGGTAALQASAHYQLGEALYSLKKFAEAKREFDQGRRIDPDYALSDPLLLFHMGETYYENADFDTARLAYRQLLERYPDKIYTKLVGLRLGDFLRDEGKEHEALQVYEQAIENASPELAMRAKLRIANLYSNRPRGDDWKRAIALYNEIIAAPAGRSLAPEAQLRKGLTLSLHGQFREAVPAFEDLAAKFPNSSLVRDNIVKGNIDDNLRAEVDRLFRGREYWETVRLFTQYREKQYKDQPYLRNFRYPVSAFEAAQAYHRLGLFDSAIGLYEELEKGDPGSLRPLVSFQRALALGDKGDLEGSEQALLQFINAHKDDIYSTDARLKLAQLYADARRFQDAQNAFRILLRDFEQNKTPELIESAPEIYFQLGMLHKELGQFSEALDAFRRTAATYNHPLQGEGVAEFVVRGQFLAADMMAELGQNSEAIAAYEQAIARYPDHERAPWARYQVGLIYRRTGQDKRALETFNTLLELAKKKPGELWESLAQQNQRDLATKLKYQDYLRQ
jgi:tetratricopeptide (TPR) repeat protein